MATVNYLINQGLLEVVTENDEYYLTEIPNLIRSETVWSEKKEDTDKINREHSPR